MPDVYSNDINHARTPHSGYQRTLLAIEIGVPGTLFVLFVVCCSLFMICKCVRSRVIRSRSKYILLTSVREDDDNDDDDYDDESEDEEGYYS